jgi:hypothetical protein
MNDLEMQLRSWAPRRPSAKVKQRIFAESKAVALIGSRGRSPHHPRGHVACSVLRDPMLPVIESIAAIAHRLKPTSFRWLAPAMAALFLMCILLNQHSTPMAASTTSPLIAMILSSNQSAAAYLPGSFQREQNGLPSDTFEWTNGSGSTSSISSLSESKGRN